MGGESLLKDVSRRRRRRACGVLAAGLLAAGLLAGCDSGSYPVAPENMPPDSVVKLAVSANPTTIATNGASTIEVRATENDLPVRVGTEIRVTTTLGFIVTETITTGQDGLAFTTLQADGNAGKAMVQAFSGTISSSDMFEVTIGDTKLTAKFCWKGSSSELTVLFRDDTQIASEQTQVYAWSWDFGDGGTSSEREPTHEYAAEGSYLVTLTVTNQGAEDSVSRFVEVPVTATTETCTS